MTDGNKALMRRWCEEVWNQQRAEAIDEMMHPDGVGHGFPDPNGTIGREEFKAVHRAFLETFQDVHVAVDEVIAEGDCTAARLTLTMSYQGSPLTFTASAFARWKNGQLMEGWNHMDTSVFAKHLAA